MGEGGFRPSPDASVRSRTVEAPLSRSEVLRYAYDRTRFADAFTEHPLDGAAALATPFPDRVPRSSTGPCGRP